MPTNEEKNKYFSSVHQKISVTNMHWAKTPATRGEQPSTYHCAALMLVYASSTACGLCSAVHCRLQHCIHNADTGNAVTNALALQAELNQIYDIIAASSTTSGKW